MPNKPLNTAVLDRAIIFAVKAHTGTQRRGKGYPYIVHPMEVMGIVATMTNDQNLLAAAALHDTISDTYVTEDQVRAEFGDAVVSLILGSREAIGTLAKDSREVKILALGNQLAIMRAIALEHSIHGDAIWNQSHIKDSKAHEERYKATADALKDLSDTLAYQEYVKLIKQVFSK